jgi:signal transduction histidine kinase
VLYQNHPGLKQYGIESYIAVPLNRRDGKFFGTLCALDPLPTDLTEENLITFNLLANLISFELEADEREQQHEVERQEMERIGKLREELMGILGHDLRNPLNAIKMATSLLKLTKKSAPAELEIIEKISNSSKRMERMIDDLLDLTRSRLGEGIPVERRPLELRQICRQVIDELAMANSKRRIIFDAQDNGFGDWDADRMSQVVSNLIGNAISYSPPDSEVRILLTGSDSEITLMVNNKSEPIPQEILTVIFDPFRRGMRTADSTSKGLGLGLYIVQQIVEAHGGRIEVASSLSEGTTFTVYLPRHNEVISGNPTYSFAV